MGGYSFQTRSQWKWLHTQLRVKTKEPVTQIVLIKLKYLYVLVCVFLGRMDWWLQTQALLLFARPCALFTGRVCATCTCTYIRLHAGPTPPVSGSLALSNWQCRHVQRMIYNTTTTVSPLQEFAQEERGGQWWSNVVTGAEGEEGMKAIKAGGL